MEPPAENSPKPAVIFDFGGVLIDWNPRYLYRKFFENEELMEHFLDEISFDEWNRLQDAGRPFSEAVAELCARHPRWCELIRAYDEQYPESLNGAIPGTVTILRRLRDAGYSLYALSNWPAEKFHLVRGNYPFMDWFKDVVISGEVGAAKPDARIFTALLDRVGLPADECLFIDDSLENIEAARALGFKIIHFRGPELLAAELEQAGLL